MSASPSSLQFNRYDGDEFLSGLNYTFHGNAPKGPWEFALYKDCGNGALVKQDLECPISTVKLNDDKFEINRMGPFQKPFMIDIEYSLNEPRCFRSYSRTLRNLPQDYPKDYPFLLSPNVGCQDSLDGDFATGVSFAMEKELLQTNDLYDNLTQRLYLYEYFVAMPGNLMKFYTYHSFGFHFVDVCHSVQMQISHPAEP